MDTLGDVRCDSDEDPNGDSKWGSGPFWGADLGELFGGPCDWVSDVPGDVPTHSCCSDGEDGKLRRRWRIRMKEEP